MFDMMCEPGKEDVPVSTQSILLVEVWTMDRQFECSVMSIPFGGCGNTEGAVGWCVEAGYRELSEWFCFKWVGGCHDGIGVREGIEIRPDEVSRA